MLKGIPSVLPPDLLKILMEMGHGDEIVIGDGNFPAASCAARLVRCDGHTAPEILDAILQLMPLENGEIHVTRPDDEKENRALHGLTRTLVANMVEGVTKGFSKELDVNGVGYRVQKQGKELVMTLGFSHLVKVSEIPGITIDVPNPNKIVISGPDKQLVGQFAAEVREKRPPEPYKGKGIKYTTEVVRRKEGKTGGKGKK